jgi:demethylmenaquinone methyltransferase / 2-methoxy-6-polyprenyl-1,4-benzoquinol methylase
VGKSPRRVKGKGAPQENSTFVAAERAFSRAEPEGVRVGQSLASDDDKAAYVRRMFGAIAPRYDLVNTVISAGLHRRWKQLAVELVEVPAGGRAVDVCCGTGDLALLLARRVGPRGQVWGVDFSAEMLRIARRRAAAAGLDAVCRFTQGDAMALAFGNMTFDAATVGFGIRNVVHPPKALAEVRRVLRPGGRLAVLEFSRPRSGAIRRLYDLYSFTLLPWMGRLVSRHDDAYLYLSTSIRTWPDQDAFAAVLSRVGFAQVRYRNMCTGIAAVHVGVRPEEERARPQG